METWYTYGGGEIDREQREWGGDQGLRYREVRAEPSLRVRFKLIHSAPITKTRAFFFFFFFFDASFLHSPLQTNIHNEHRQT